jgi:hypothetical protein
VLVDTEENLARRKLSFSFSKKIIFCVFKKFR